MTNNQCNCDCEVIDAVFELNVADNDHTILINRDANDQHPIEAITGLRDELNSIESSSTDLDSKINKEIQDRETADSSLQSNIDAETSARQSAISELDSKITTANQSISNLETSLSQEVTDRTNADSSLSTQIQSEAQTRLTNDNALGTRIDNTNTRIGTVESNLSTTNTNVSNLSTRLTQEITNRTDADTSLSNRITSIENVIPNDATPSNQLADKAFVNSSIASSTANFIGTFNSVADLEAYPTSSLTPNDYAFVIKVESGNTYYDRYKWNGTEWLFEYELNNSSFTADQWAAINSTATKAKIDQIGTNTTNIGTNTQSINTINTTLSGYGNIVTHNTSEFATASQGEKADTALQPQDNITQLTNNAGFITKSVNNLDNYTLSTTISSTYQTLNNLEQSLSTSTTKYPSSNAVKTAIENIDALPDQTGQNGKYLTTNGTSASWGTVTIGNGTVTFKKDGATIAGQSFTLNQASNVEIDLGATGLVDDVKIGSTSLVSNKIATIPQGSTSSYGVVQFDTTKGITANNGIPETIKATTNDIDAASDNYKPIVPANLLYAVKYAVTNNTNTLNATEKSAACTWIGAVKGVTINNVSIVSNGVANIPYATTSDKGVVAIGSGLSVASGTVSTSAATTAELEAKSNQYKPVVPSNLDNAVKVAVTTNTNTLTSAEKNNATNWILPSQSGNNGKALVTNGTNVDYQYIVEFVDWTD